MDAWQLASMIGMLAVVVLAYLVIVPLLGEVMYYVISNWFGQEINNEAYWTGVGLLAIFGMLISTSKRED